VKITADTNILIRVLAEDHPEQTALAKAALTAAEMVAIPTIALSEAVWVLRSGYGLSASAVAAIVRRLLENGRIEVDRQLAEVGLAMLEAGGDFADGVIAHEGRRLGGEVFVSFDRQAVRLLQARGEKAQLLTP
jgi:predicted nucleic-acid-binding protein